MLFWSCNEEMKRLPCAVCEKHRDEATRGEINGNEFRFVKRSTGANKGTSEDTAAHFSTHTKAMIEFALMASSLHLPPPNFLFGSKKKKKINKIYVIKTPSLLFPHHVSKGCDDSSIDSRYAHIK